MDKFVKYTEKVNRKSAKNIIGKQKTLSNGSIGEWKMNGGNIVFRIVKGVKNNSEYMKQLRNKRKSAEERRKITNNIRANNKEIDKQMLGGNKKNRSIISQTKTISKGRNNMLLKRQSGGRLVTSADGGIGHKPICPVGEPILLSEAGNAPTYKCQ